MLLNNGKKLINALFTYSSSTDKPTTLSGSLVSTSYWYKSFNGEYSNSVTTSYNYNDPTYTGVFPGVNLEKPSADEYAIPDNDKKYAGLTNTSITLTKVNNKRVYSAVYINNTADPISVNCTYMVTGGCLVEHTLLDTPIIVQPEQSILITYTIGF